MPKDRSNRATSECIADAVEPGLDQIIATALLQRRPSRTPDHAAESRAFLALAQAMGEAPHSVLQKLVDTAVELTGADSAGISVLESNGGKPAFRWRATAGAFFPFAQSTLPRDFSPCGFVIDCNAPQLMSDPVRFYPYIANLRPHVSEVLLVPFHRGKQPIGTVWVVAHSDAKHFDAEDERIITSLSKFASAALQVVSKVEESEAHARLLQAEVAERERVEEALRESEARLSAVLDNAPAMVYVVDANNRFSFINRRWGEVFGLTNTATAGRSLYDFFPKVIADQFAANNRKVLDARSPHECEEVAPHADGEHTYISKKVPLFDRDGTPYAICGISTDITDRKRAEETIRESEERLHLALAIARMGTFDIDLLTDVVTVNDAGRDIYGWAVGEGLTFAKVQTHFHPEDHDQVLQRVAEAFDPAGPGEFAVEHRIIRTDGAIRWIRVRGRAQFDSALGERRAVRCVGTYIDVTEQKEVEREREQLLAAEQAARRDAETANRAKDRFLAVLSHELRTPLTPVALTATAMEMDPRLPLEFREDVAMLRRNVELETRLIDDLLDLSRVTSGKLRLNPQPTNVHRLVQHVLETIGAELHEKQLKVELALTASNDLVNADPARLQQTLWNLLKNAAKFTPAGGRVSMSTRNDADTIAIEIADTGKGIAADTLPHIFDPFEQGEAEVTRQYGGMGLGLAIAKAVVDLHGGTIRASSDGEGKGAVFTVSLPLDATRRSMPPAADDSSGVGENDSRVLRLLLVEDHVDSAKVLIRLLRLDGIRVEWAGTLAAALDLAASEPFDVVVSDLGLPDGSGYELMRELLRQRHIVGIAMSGYGMEDDVRHSREAGFAEHLVKPVSLPQLRDAIRRAVPRGR